MEVDKVVVGDLALENSELFLKLLEDFPDITLALDVELNQNRRNLCANGTSGLRYLTYEHQTYLVFRNNQGLKQILC